MTLKTEDFQKKILGFGTADGIRTHDLQSRSLALYPAELQPHIRPVFTSGADSGIIPFTKTDSPFTGTGCIIANFPADGKC